jgi:uncharacterized protein (DUF4415 family)
MARKEHIVSYTMDEIKAMIARGESKTDFDREDSQEEIERQIAEDPDLFVPDNWEETIIWGIPEIGKKNKRLTSVRYSARVVDYFKSTGKGWQTRMDAVLLAYVDRQERRGQS